MKSCIHAINPAIPVDVISDESEAVESAIEKIGRNEIVFVFIDKLSVVMNSLLKFDPQPVEAIPMVADRPSSQENVYGRYSDERSYAHLTREVNRDGLHS
jgi:urate oxidase